MRVLVNGCFARETKAAPPIGLAPLPFPRQESV